VQWDSWFKVETGMVPVRPNPPVVAGPEPLKVTVLPQKDVQKATRSLLVGLAFAAVAGFHGYKRSGGSWLWALVWATGGFTCPLVTIPIAVHQGYGNRKV
jgi:hypothetical protein